MALVFPIDRKALIQKLTDRRRKLYPSTVYEIYYASDEEKAKLEELNEIIDIIRNTPLIDISKLQETDK